MFFVTTKRMTGLCTRFEQLQVRNTRQPCSLPAARGFKFQIFVMPEAAAACNMLLLLGMPADAQLTFQLSLGVQPQAD
jgi:hypothetical protein